MLMGLSPSRSAAQITRFEGAKVYRDGRFIEVTLVTRRGVVIDDNAAPLEGEGSESVSLAGKFLLPAFGDVHTHRFTEEDADAQQMCLSAGFLYIHNLNGATLSRARNIKYTNNHTSPDVRYANAGFTCTGGHPVPVYTYLTSRDPSMEKDKIMQLINNYNFYTTDSVAEVDEKWPKFARSGPDLVKIFLLHSERWDGASNAKSDGLRPEVARAITERARLAGLRVAAHVESAADASVAVDCGVSLLGHMPGYGIKPEQDPAPYVVDDALMKSAAARGTALSPTLGLLYADPNDTAGVQKIRAWKVEQVRRWKDAGVMLLYGSDNYFEVQSELRAMIESNIWSGGELVELLSVRTPRWIFPGRSVGALAPGFEASFIVLASNPLEDPNALLSIEAVYKDGLQIWEPKPTGR
jgi:imidazolonepropionase-like amidohydrolase